MALSLVDPILMHFYAIFVCRPIDARLIDVKLFLEILIFYGNESKIFDFKGINFLKFNIINF